MTAAARSALYDPARRLFLSEPKKQVSWASQAWMVHAGVVSGEEGAAVLRSVMSIPDALRPRTPYLHHYEQLLSCVELHAVLFPARPESGLNAAQSNTAVRYGVDVRRARSYAHTRI